MKKLILLLILLIGGCASNDSPTGNVIYEDFARYLTEEGVVMVGAEWCGHCQNQKAIFGDSFKYVTFIDATVDPELAANYDVPGYPTWILANGEQLVGEQSIETLMEKTGYESG